MSSNSEAITNEEKSEGIIDLDFHQVRKAFLILRSLNHELRQKIISIISESKRTTVTEIYKKLNIEQSIVSQHLALLRKAGILKTEKNKKYIYYSINSEKVKLISDCINEFMK